MFNSDEMFYDYCNGVFKSLQNKDQIVCIVCHDIGDRDYAITLDRLDWFVSQCKTFGIAFIKI